MQLGERANPGLHGHVVARVLEVAPERGASILDLGCGTGALLVHLRDQGYTKLDGVDIAPPSGIEGIRFHAADLDSPKLPFPDQSIDLVLAVEVVEHLENPGAVFRELRRTLAPSGQVLLTTPNVHSVEAAIRFLLLGRLKQFDALGDPTHVYPVFSFPFHRLVARHGFAVVERWGYPDNGASPTSRRGLRLLALLARLLGLHGHPDGDQLCLLLKQDVAAGTRFDNKTAALTAHYG